MTRILDPDDREADVNDGAGVAFIEGLVAVGAAYAEHVVGAVGAAVLNATGQMVVHRFIKPIVRDALTNFSNELGEDLGRLKNAGRIDYQALEENPRFIEAVATATRLAMFTARDEKRRALRNAVLNSALSRDMDAIEQKIFFGLIERFSELHLLVLRVLQNPGLRPSPSGKPYGHAFSSALREVLLTQIPEMRMHSFLADQVWSELRSSNLAEGADSLDNAGEGPSVTRKRTTEFGDRFLAFITSPLPK